MISHTISGWIYSTLVSPGNTRPTTDPNTLASTWTGPAWMATRSPTSKPIRKNTTISYANNKVKAKTGHGGVPLMVFRGEPFFGQDKFDVFFWRLARNSLTRKDGAALPSVSWTG